MNRLILAQKLLGAPLYDYQREFLSSTSQKRLVLKARQSGFSTIAALEALLDCLLNRNYTVLLLSIEEKKSIRLLNKVRSFLRNLPNHEEVVGETDNKSELQFINGSCIISLTSNPSNARGYTANSLIFDEAASMVDWDETYVAALPTISRGGRITIISTPRGKENRFYRLWVEENDYEKFEVPWTDCPDLNPEEMEKRREELGFSYFAQEYECSFENALGNIFSWSELEGCLTEDFPKAGLTVLGYDPARVQDQSAVLLVRLHKGIKTVLPLADLKGYPYFQQAQRINQYVSDFHVSKVVFDKGGGLGVTIQESLRNLGPKLVGTAFTPKLKEEMVRNIKAELQRGNFRIAQSDFSNQLIRELFDFNVDNSRFVQYKQGGHMDFLAALILAWTEIKKGNVRMVQTSINPRSPNLSKYSGVVR